MISPPADTSVLPHLSPSKDGVQFPSECSDQSIKQMGEQLIDQDHHSSFWRKKVQTIMTQDAELQQTYMQPNADVFKLRGESYLTDRTKVSAQKPMFELAWLEVYEGTTDQLRHISQNPVSLIQKCKGKWGDDESPTIFVLNILLPGTPVISVASYYIMSKDSSEKSPGSLLCDRFFSESDDFRKSRLKLIPRVEEGPWIIRKGVGSRPIILSNSLKVEYFSGPSYLEAFVDISADPVAKRITALSRSQAKRLVVDLAVLFEAQTEEELPEALVGCIRLSHLKLTNTLKLEENSTAN